MSGPTTSFVSSLINQSFFGPCQRCATNHSSREATVNYWDCDSHEGLCSVCVTEKARDSVIQARHSSLIYVHSLSYHPHYTLNINPKQCMVAITWVCFSSNMHVLFPPICPTGPAFLIPRRSQGRRYGTPS